MTTILPARNIRNNWGMNGLVQGPIAAGSQGYPPNAVSLSYPNCAQCINYLQTRWSRHQTAGTNFLTDAQGVQNALVTGNYFDPNLRVELIILSYANSPGWTVSNAQGVLTTAGPSPTGVLPSAMAVTTANGGKLISCLEGPNEFGQASQGNGSYLINTTTIVVNNSANNGCGVTAVMGGFDAWATALHTYSTTNASLFTNADPLHTYVELISPTILDGQGAASSSPSGLPGDYESASPNGINISGKTNFNTAHWYGGPTSGGVGSPCSPLTNIGGNNSLLFNNMYNGMKAGMSGGANNVDMVVSECGSTTNAGWAQDGISMSWFMMKLLLDTFALGGHRLLFYTALNDFDTSASNFTNSTGSPGNNGFTWFYNNDPTKPTPQATCLRNISTLMSLATSTYTYTSTPNAYANPANLVDYNTYTSPFTGSGFAITVTSGTAQWGYAGHYLICTKSDNSVMIFVWNEDQGDDGTTAATSQVSNQLKINVALGGTYNYKVWDPTGNTAAQQGTIVAPTSSPAQIASGNASTVPLTLYGSPLAIEVFAVATESTDGTFVTTVGPSITDATLNTYAIDSNAKITTNSVEESAATSVIELYYHNHTLYYMNSNFVWYSRPNKTTAWATAAAPFTESASGTAITTVGPTFTDVYGNVYSLSSDQYVVTNGVKETSISSQVVEIYYYNRQLYQYNGSNWYTRISPNTTYYQTTSPVVTVTSPPAAVTNFQAQSLTGSGCTFLWTPTATTASQSIYCKIHNTSTYTQLTSIQNGATTTYVATTLASSTTYDAYIVEINSLSTVPYPISNVVTFTTTAGPVAHFLRNGPTGPVITNGGLGINLYNA